MEGRIPWCKPYGSAVAIITPFRGGHVDLTALQTLINWHVECKTAAIVTPGTTGEASTLSHSEQAELIDAAVLFADGKIPIIAGIGSNCTKEAIELTQKAEAAGASAGLSIVPYYNKPTQEGLFRHFSAVAGSSPDFPVMLYDVGSRTGVSLTIETIVRLMRAHENIVGLKEANGDMKRMSKLMAAVVGSGFAFYSGDDFTNFPAMMLGAWGTISVVANVLPERMSNMWRMGLGGQIALAREDHFYMERMAEAMFIETNPGPVKAALAMMDKCSPETRLPMTPPSKENMEVLRRTLRHYNLIGPALYGTD